MQFSEQGLFPFNYEAYTNFVSLFHVSEEVDDPSKLPILDKIERSVQLEKKKITMFKVIAKYDLMDNIIYTNRLFVRDDNQLVVFEKFLESMIWVIANTEKLGTNQFRHNYSCLKQRHKKLANLIMSQSSLYLHFGVKLHDMEMPCDFFDLRPDVHICLTHFNRSMYVPQTNHNDLPPAVIDMEPTEEERNFDVEPESDDEEEQISEEDDMYGITYHSDFTSYDVLSILPDVLPHTRWNRF